MTRLLVHVEGHTERTFVNEILAPHLYAHGFSSVSARLLGNSRRRDERGGVRGWPQTRRNIIGHLQQDRNCSVTTMVDYYGLPDSGGGAWPKRKQAARSPFPESVQQVEGAMTEEICGHLGADFDSRRFVPYLMMHEFEALLFSDCEKFSAAIGQPDAASLLQDIRDRFPYPEEINDSPDGAPSKRISAILEGYRKPLMGLRGIQAIGLPIIRTQCPHFSGWLSRLENLSAGC